MFRSTWSRRIRIPLVITTALVISLTIQSASALTPATPGFGQGIEPLAAFQSEAGCKPAVRPGTQALGNLLRATYPGHTIYYTRACGGAASSHHLGRAVDWMTTNSTQEADAQAFINWLLASDQYGNKNAMARRLGVMYLIHNGKQWSSYKNGTWSSYTGSDPHTDHVHISLTNAGAGKSTSFWTSGSAPVVAITARSAVASVSPSPDRIDLFVRGLDNGIFQKTYISGSGWGDWVKLPGTNTYSSPAAVSPSPGQIVLFNRGLDNAIYQATYANGSWGAWMKVPGTNTDSAPAVVSPSPGKIVLFNRGSDNGIWYGAYENGTWSSWQKVPGTNTYSTPAVVSPSKGRIELFNRGADNSIYQATYENGNWSNWTLHSAITSSAPGAVIQGNTVELFNRGSDNGVWFKASNNDVLGGLGEWGGWVNLGGGTLSAPSAISLSASHIDVFAPNIDGVVMHNFNTGSGWSGWQTLGGIVAAE